MDLSEEAYGVRTKMPARSGLLPFTEEMLKEKEIIDNEKHVMQETIQNLELELEQLHTSHRTELSEIEETQNEVAS